MNSGIHPPYDLLIDYRTCVVAVTSREAWLSLPIAVDAYQKVLGQLPINI